VGTITGYISNASFPEKMFSHLRSRHGICTVLVDENGQPESLNGEAIRELPRKRYYPIQFETDVGGIRCSAETDAVLDAAEPLILICIEAIQEILQKDWILKQTTDEMLDLSSQLHFLLNLANTVAGVHDLRRYCSLVLEEVARAIQADSALACLTGQNQESDFQVGYELDDGKKARWEQDPVLNSLPEGKIVVVSLQDGTSVLVAPIRENGMQAGYMAFFKSAEKRFFTSYEKKFVGIIDHIISPTMEALKLYESLHELYLNTIKALAAAIDAKDPCTHGHSFRVAKYSTSIGKQLQVSREDLKDLEVAAYMHDLGKIGIPEHILVKPDKLTPQEFAEIKKHPLLTDKILEPIALPQRIVDAAVQHHERLDGRGYPLGISGDAISYFARIIAVADVFDALTSTRFYRDAMTVEDALNLLCADIDTAFDRQVVLALLSALQNEKPDQDLAKLYRELRFLGSDPRSVYLEKLAGLLRCSGSDRPKPLNPIEQPVVEA
jgi:HD-GYP domain-containing protein (c-di-GMP phosphodiesterase class II)